MSDGIGALIDDRHSLNTSGTPLHSPTAFDENPSESRIVVGDKSAIALIEAASWRPVGSMHYERAPRFRRSKLGVAPPPLRYAVQGFAPLRRR